MACKAYRDRARIERGIERPEMYVQSAKFVRRARVCASFTKPRNPRCRTSRFVDIVLC